MEENPEEKERQKKELRNKEAPQDVRMRYQIFIDDIKYIKTRQWTVTYYLLLIFAAIVGFSKAVGLQAKGDFSLGRNLLSLLAFLTAALGTFYQCNFQSRIKQYRTLILEIINEREPKLSDDFAAWDRGSIGDIDEYTSWWKDFWVFTFPFILMLWLGVVFVLFYLFDMSRIAMDSFFSKIQNSLGFLFIVLGSLGMIGFATKFPFSTRIKDLKRHPARWLGLNGYHVWKWSWIFILLGSLIHVSIVWIS